MFLELMVAQLRYQDPLIPSDSGEFLAQSAQFTALEKMQDVSDRVGALLGAQMAFGAGAMVGQQVSWIDLVVSLKLRVHHKPPVGRGAAVGSEAPSAFLKHPDHSRHVLRVSLWWVVRAIPRH